MNTLPESMNTLPESMNTLPECMNTLPESMNTLPESMNTLPESMNTLPESMNTLPESMNTLPESMNTLPESMNTLPESMNTLPESMNTLPESVNTLRVVTAHFPELVAHQLGRVPSASRPDFALGVRRPIQVSPNPSSRATGRVFVSSARRDLAQTRVSVPCHIAFVLGFNARGSLGSE